MTLYSTCCALSETFPVTLSKSTYYTLTTMIRYSEGCLLAKARISSLSTTYHYYATSPTYDSVSRPHKSGIVFHLTDCTYLYGMYSSNTRPPPASSVPAQIGIPLRFCHFSSYVLSFYFRFYICFDKLDYSICF